MWHMQAEPRSTPRRKTESHTSGQRRRRGNCRRRAEARQGEDEKTERGNLRTVELKKPKAASSQVTHQGVVATLRKMRMTKMQ